MEHYKLHISQKTMNNDSPALTDQFVKPFTKIKPVNI